MPPTTPSGLSPASSDIENPRITARDSMDLDSALDGAGIPVDAEVDIKATPRGTPVVQQSEKEPSVDAADAAATPSNVKIENVVVTPAPEKPKTPTEPAKNQTPAEPATVPATEPQAPQPGSKEYDQEIDGIDQPKNLNPKNQANWKALRDTAHKYKVRYEDSIKYLAEIKPQIGVVPKETQQELESLRSYRRQFDIENDPEFKQKYDVALTNNDNDIYDILKSVQAEDSLIQDIKTKGISNIQRSFWDEKIFAPLMKSGIPKENQAAVLIKNKLDNHIQLDFERHKAVVEASKGQSQWLKDRETREVNQRTEDVKVLNTRLSEIQTQIPWAKLQEVPTNATPEQKAAIESNNAIYKRMEPIFEKALGAKDPHTKFETAVAACMAFKLSEDIDVFKAENARLLAENMKLKKAGQTNAAGIAAPPVNAPKKTNEYVPKQKNEVSIENALQALGI